MKHGTLTKDNHAALWHGRFKEGPDAAAVEFETSIYVDERMAMDDIKGSIAHAKMLGKNLCQRNIKCSNDNRVQSCSTQNDRHISSHCRWIRFDYYKQKNNIKTT